MVFKCNNLSLREFQFFKNSFRDDLLFRNKAMFYHRQFMLTIGRHNQRSGQLTLASQKNIYVLNIHLSN